MFLSLHFSPLFAKTEAIETVIFLLIAAATAAFNWWKKRKQDSDWSDVEQPRPAVPDRPYTLPPREVPSSTPKKTSDWEEELRRMLEGTNVPPSTPPPIIREHRRDTPPPLPTRTHAEPAERPTMALPKVFQEIKTYEGHCQNCGGHLEFPSNMTGDSVACPHCFQHTALEPIQQSRFEKVMHRTEMATLSESATAYERASRLEESVAAQLAAVSSHPVQSTSVEQFKKRSAEIDQVVALLRKPQTARQAILATVILGPPKAFEV